MSADESAEVEIFIEPADLPTWYEPLIAGLLTASPEELVRFRAPADEQVRHSAVLVLFADGADLGDLGPDVLLIERAADMRSHAGQPAFPGGAEDPGDSGPISTALREAQEETGLDPAGVIPVAALPQMWLPPSGFVVTPVLGWWRETSPIAAADPAEVADVHRVAIAELVNPANRVKVSHPSGYVGSGFEVNGMLVWGFTGLLLDRLLDMAGWALPWEDGARVVPFDDGWRASPDS
ncbi:MAG TPA: coenzyme A pyrophosphatase [Actinobacteria bacterium]|jgi:8-oxo-dGTP pyrophosphatase MutT (NUDIX family)|nr:coenzyme A pyrophosphatase [Actinomycetota bacterium]